MFTDNIFLVICGLFFAFILVYFVPPRSYEIGDRDLGGDRGGGSLWEESVIDCDAFVASSSSSLSFSSKTAYSFNSKANEDLSSVDGCTVNKLYIIFRHGTRYPGKNHIRRYDRFSEKLSKLKGSSDKIKRLKEWKNPFLIDKYSHLSSTGRKELYCLAKRYKNRYSVLIKDDLPSDDYHFMSTHKTRCIQSALSFAEGLFDGFDVSNGAKAIGLQINDTTLRFYDYCEHYQSISRTNESLAAFVDKFLSSDAILSALSEVQEQLDNSKEVWIVGEKDLLDMYLLCAMERANFGQSNWCSLLSDASLQALEYYYDLQFYWKKGYGHSINWAMSCHLLNDIIDSLSSPLSSPKVLLRFAHGETLVPLLGALSLYVDDNHLLPSNYDVMSSLRQFRVGKIAPFGGNLAFVVYRCLETSKAGRDFIQILSNEIPVNLNHSLCSREGNGMRDGWCPLESLPEILTDISKKLVTYPCSLGTLCSGV